MGGPVAKMIEIPVAEVKASLTDNMMATPASQMMVTPVAEMMVTPIAEVMTREFRWLTHC